MKGDVHGILHRERPQVVKRIALWFALSGYLLTFLYYYGPYGIAYSEPVLHALPFSMCVVAFGGMPVPAVAIVTAPVNALIYSVVGALLGLGVSEFKTNSVPSRR